MHSNSEATPQPAPLRVAFAGTPDFAAVALQALLAAGYPVPLVLTQPDRAAGRGLQLQASSVKRLALAHGLPLLQPRSLRLEGRWGADAALAQAALQAAAPDMLVVAAYGLLLPPWTLALPRLGCVNIHASLLPRWRGAAPIQRAIEAGDAVSGITLMQMDAGLDTGPMLARAETPIADHDTSASLHQRLAELGARTLLQALPALAAGAGVAEPQSEHGVCYAAKVEKAEGLIDWQQDAAQLARRVRALDPAPGCHTWLAGQPLKVWAAQALPTSAGSAPAAAAGTVLAASAAGVEVQTGAGVLRLTELQRSGGKRLGAAAFLAGCALTPGTRLGAD